MAKAKKVTKGDSEEFVVDETGYEGETEVVDGKVVPTKDTRGVII